MKFNLKALQLMPSDQFLILHPVWLF